ncbi:transporter [Sphingobacterium hungaricum]|uniref:MetA-pathway of phenol degradation n=1 Tax=Sphingobacterium hungaricum TaxID=2082723 RepID=A0A928UZN9_9SPHI|nr:transporter [Sphingobacterium hungaricum]MBE8714009.1 hypothetical protein [Sphingobacterium hungaricum]
MKKIKSVILILCLFSLPISTFACDICGCGVGTYYLGILPEFNKRFVGLRYQHKSLQTHLGPQGERTAITADETYQSMEVWGAWNFGTRWRAMAILPYNFNQRQITGANETGRKQGLGDIALMGYYKVFENMNATSSNKIFVHSLWAGAGIKVPTGKYDPSEQDDAEQNSPNNFQLGTASTDFTLNAIYDVRIMDLGLNINASYKMNTENKHEYRYGNKFSTNAIAYYKFNIDDKVRISPNAGAMYETQTKDVIFSRFDVAQSGGNSITGLVGAEVNVNAISFGGNFQAPIQQDLASGRAKAGNRFLLHVSYSF